jgi:hypothetical protein
VYGEMSGGEMRSVVSRRGYDRSTSMRAVAFTHAPPPPPPHLSSSGEGNAQAAMMAAGGNGWQGSHEVRASHGELRYLPPPNSAVSCGMSLAVGIDGRVSLSLIGAPGIAIHRHAPPAHAPAHFNISGHGGHGGTAAKSGSGGGGGGGGSGGGGGIDGVGGGGIGGVQRRRRGALPPPPPSPPLPPLIPIIESNPVGSNGSIHTQLSGSSNGYMHGSIPANRLEGGMDVVRIFDDDKWYVCSFVHRK